MGSVEERGISALFVTLQSQAGMKGVGDADLWKRWRCGGS